VVTVVKDNKAREVEVKLGIQAQDRVQVLEGIAPGDLVATENGYGLPDDCPVRILQGDTPPDGPKVP
jgi:membrane fusion protein (multidrug efflux system)